MNKITIYSSENPLRNPWHLLLEMFSSLNKSKELAFRLTSRDISAKYRQSILGYFWAFLPPIATGLIFIFLNQVSIINVNTPSDVPYPVFVFAGTILWLLFTDSINVPLKVIHSNKSMLGKINFPREALLISGFLQVLFDFTIRLLILVVVMILFKIKFQFVFILFPFASLAVCLLGFVLGILLIPLGMLFNDVASALPMVTQLWFFVTPVVYSIPETGILSTFFKFNPVTPVLTGVRELITHQTILNPLSFFITLSLSILGLLVAWIIYRVTLPILIERM